MFMNRLLQPCARFLSALAVLALPMVAFGQTRFANPIAAGSLTELLTKVLDAAILILFPFIVLYIVYAGFKLVTAQGNSTKIEEAKRQIMYALIGAVIVLAAGAISIAIKTTVENIRGEPFPT